MQIHFNKDVELPQSVAEFKWNNSWKLLHNPLRMFGELSALVQKDHGHLYAVLTPGFE